MNKWRTNEINDLETHKDTSWLENKFADVFNFIPNIHKQELNLRAVGTDEKQEKLRLTMGAQCYGTNGVLAIKINILLRFNTNSSCSADKREGTGDPNTLSEFYQ